VLDRDLELYGHNLRIEFLERLRGERRFESVEALVEQMHRDVERARELCG
jgi:riboflavin kinase/FMN adenylyltransferase